MNDYKTDINLINNSIIDARHVLDDATPCKGIYKTLLYWILSFFTISAMLSIIPNIAQYYHWLDSDIYYSVYRIMTIILFLVPFSIYVLSLYKIDMRLKEISFLKTFLYVPLLTSLFRILFPLSYYLNFDFLLALQDVMPMDIIVLTIGLFHLYLYFKNKNFFILIFLSITYIIIYSVIAIYLFQLSNTEINSLFTNLIQIKNYLFIFNDYSLVITVIMLLSLLIIKKYGK
jgi:hypothetical protein